MPRAQQQAGSVHENGPESVLPFWSAAAVD